MNEMGGAGSVLVGRDCGEMIKIVPDIYRCQDNDDNEEIDVDALVLALRKLSCIFVDKRHLNQSFVDTVLSHKHKNFDAQFIAVALWIGQHDKYVQVTPYELFSLIKYVELYRPLKSRKGMPEESSCDPFDDAGTVSLTVPRIREIPSLTGKIRAREAKMLSVGCSARYSPVDNTVRLRKLSTTDDLSSVDLEEYDII